MRELLKASYYDKWNYINGKTYWVLTISLELQSRTGANQVPPKQQDTNHVPLKQSTGTSNDLRRQNFMILNNKTNALAIMNFIEVFNVQWIYMSVSRWYLEFNKKIQLVTPWKSAIPKEQDGLPTIIFQWLPLLKLLVCNQPTKKKSTPRKWMAYNLHST